jgi:glyoxylase-like metal-dependent hydrolase (beta-lactamase superfamily II)
MPKRNSNLVGQNLLKLNLKKGNLVCFSGKLLSSNVYLLVVGNRAVAVDSGMPWTANLVLDYLNKNQLHLEYILLTHSHFDHVMGLNRLRTSAETKVVAHIRSKRGDLKVDDRETLEAIDNQLSFLVIYTGIHKADHVWYSEKNNHILFVGDYFPTSKELEAIRNRHNVEPMIILPGHGKPETVS